MEFEYTPWIDGAGGVRMGLQPLAEQDWLQQPADMAIRLAERRHLVATRRDAVWGRTPGRDVDAALAATAKLLAASARPLAARRPTSNHGADDAAPARTLAATDAGGKAGVTSAGDDHDFLAAGLQVCEDLCVLLPAGDGERDDHVLRAALLCAPSFWRLHDKLGQPLPSVHAPVEGLEAKIGARIRAFLHNLPEGRLFTRGNWHLHTTGERFHPAPDDWAQAQALHADEIADRLWVRCERQTLRRVPGSRALLFTILVYIQPLAALATRPALAHALWDAYIAMPEDERISRHFNELSVPLRAWLDGLPPGGNRAHA